jgi:hypothetical protein
MYGETWQYPSEKGDKKAGMRQNVFAALHGSA